MKKLKKKIIRIEVDKKVLDSSKISLDEFKGYLDYLSQNLKAKFPEIFGTKINHIGIIHQIQELVEILETLKSCRGFKKHLDNYTKSQFISNFFVGIVAAHLRRKFNNITLEPSIVSTGKRSDILLNYERILCYFECKTINTRKFEGYKNCLSAEHEYKI